MMKKLFILGMLAAFSAPVFAADKQEAKEGPKHLQRPRQEMMQKDPAKVAAFKAMQEKRKATAEKMEKLVKQYKAAKEGSKKQTAAKAEIAQLLAEVRDEQIEQRAKGLEGFEKRLADMKTRLAAEQKPEAKTAWVDKMTERVIAADGKLGKVFGKPGKKGSKGHFGKGGFEKGHKGPGMHNGHGRQRGMGPDAGHEPEEDHILPMPPAPEEEI